MEYFGSLTQKDLAHLIRSTKKELLIALPMFHQEIAEAIMSVATVESDEKIEIHILVDFDAKTFRQGYGDINSIEQLFKQDIDIKTLKDNRISFVISDQTGYFLFIESRSLIPADKETINAVRIDPVSIVRLKQFFFGTSIKMNYKDELVNAIIDEGLLLDRAKETENHQIAPIAKISKDELKEVGYEASSIWVLLKQSGVRQSLQKLGYQTVAFKTTYAWSELTDAEVYLGPGLQPAFVQTLTPFEMLLLQTSAASIISDSLTIQQSSQYDLTKSPFAGHIQTMQYMLNELPAVSKLPGHKFVFVHVLIPHIPYVFKADGSLQTDTGYFSGEQAQPINEDYLRDGYTAEVAFINSQMVAITREILANSTTPPIIVIHGDHGLRDDNRLKIFEAVYLPGGEDFLYPNITPVNLFRVIFNARFGTDYDLLPDASYSVQGSLSEEVVEDAPACLP